MEMLGDPQFWTGLGQIILINIVLSGDNAVVIALAARSLPPRQQRQAILWGSGAAVLMRILLTIVAVELLRLPFLKIVGGLLLLWIAVQLMLPEEEGEGGARAGIGFWAAMRTILIADLVMSLDNVIAVAAAAKGSLTLLILGLAISIPLVKSWVDAAPAMMHWAAPVAGALLVVATGTWLARQALARRVAPVELGAPVAVAAPAPGAGRRLFNRILLPVDASDQAARAVD